MYRHLTFLLAALGLAQGAAAQTINFDTDTGGAALASGTNISNTYNPIGVTLGCINGTGGSFNECTGNAGGSFDAGNVYSMTGTPALSSPNVFGLSNATVTGTTIPVFSDTYINDQEGFGTAGFSTPQQQVSIASYSLLNPEVTGGPNNFVFLDTYDSTGHFIGAATLLADSLNELGMWETLTFTSSSADISFVAFSTTSSLGEIYTTEFDNLCFGTTSTSCTGGTTGGGPPVPEPGVLGLMSLSLMGFGFGLARRRQRAA